MEVLSHYLLRLIESLRVKRETTKVLLKYLFGDLLPGLRLVGQKNSDVERELE
jgi:hypothetical protein